jgi:hypothetical protein
MGVFIIPTVAENVGESVGMRVEVFVGIGISVGGEVGGGSCDNDGINRDSGVIVGE